MRMNRHFRSLIVSGIVLSLLASACSVTPGVPDVVDETRVNSYQIESGLDPMELFDRPPPEGWAPVMSEERLGLRLPYDWPDRYRLVFGQFFNPWTYRQNVGALCGYATTHGRGETLDSLADELFDHMLAHTVRDRGARFVTYSFEYWREEGTLAPGWTSAFGNGAVMASNIALYKCFGEQRYLDVAWQLARALTLLGGPGGDDRWIATELEDGSIWFEEYPYDDPPQARVLNGHIFAVYGLYYLYQHTGDEDVLALLNAGITAIERHAHLYRRPGQVNLYDLRPPDLSDYGPARTIFQQDVLCRMTGDPAFLELRDEFAADMPEEAARVTLSCELSG